MPSEYGAHGGTMKILSIVVTTSFLLVATIVIRRLFARRLDGEWTELVGRRTSHNGPVTICRIIGDRGNGEPIITNRSPSEDKNMPWETRRNEEGANHFFEWQWKDRTEDDPGDTYYSPTGGNVFYSTENGLATIKNILAPSRWFQFKKTSDHSEDNNGVYNRR